MKKEVKIKKLDPKAEVPMRMTDGSAGYDIFALEDTELPDNQVVLVRTGLSVQIPKGHYLQLQIRGSVARSSIIIPNAPGIIDEDYRGEILVPLFKLGNSTGISIYGNTVVPAGARIAQIILLEYSEMEFKEVDDLDNTRRGDGGFGSTDVNCEGRILNFNPFFEGDCDDQ